MVQLRNPTRRYGFAAIATLLPALLSVGCNKYELFRMTGFEQASLSNSADVLFVIDNSDSMQFQSEALALSFDAFVRGLTADSESFTTNGLIDAVDNYKRFADDSSALLNFQLAITTTDVDETNGGILGGLPIVRRTDDAPGQVFIENLLCEATCFGEGVANDPGYQCGQPLGSAVSTQYLECACDAAPGTRNCGSAVEEPLEAVFMAMCRAVDNPPLACFDAEINEGFTAEQVGSNRGMLRPNSTFIPVIISDEGDDSRRMTSGDIIPRQYFDLFGQFNQRMTWAVIGPYLDPGLGDFPCPSGASRWGATRLQYLVNSTSGVYVPILSPDNGCEPRSFDAALEELGRLLQNLITSFPLQSIPVDGSIVVVIDGDVIDESDLLGFDDLDLPQWSDGWTYRAEDNSVQFFGQAIPQTGSDVRVYYRPQSGMPRPLPF